MRHTHTHTSTKPCLDCDEEKEGRRGKKEKRLALKIPTRQKMTDYNPTEHRIVYRASKSVDWRTLFSSEMLIVRFG